jgi:hypothetical protein
MMPNRRVVLNRSKTKQKMITVSIDMGFPFRVVESSIQIRYSFFRVHLRQHGIHGQSFGIITGNI